MSELEPCPLCGGKFKMSQEPNDNGYVAGKFYIYHAGGGGDCPIDIRRHFESAEEAAEAWNRRALSSSSRIEGEAEDDTTQIAVDICDAVIQWIVKHDLGLADDEFSVGDVISILDDLWAAEDDSPGDPKAAEAVLRSLAVPQLETKPAAFEVLDHVNGTYVTTNEQSALATEFPYNGLYRRAGALKP